MTEQTQEARIFAKVAEIAAGIAGVDAGQIAWHSRLVDDLGFDSLDLVEFVIEIEEAFDVNVPDQVAETVRTVGEAVEMLRREFPAAAASGPRHTQPTIAR